MNDQIELLSTTECKTIADALYILVNECPERAGLKAEYDALGTNKSLAVFVVGGRYKQHYISGGFAAEINFYIAYKSNPTSSKLRIDAQAYVGRIMQWLEEEKDLPLLTDGRTITKISARGVPYKDETSQDKTTVYAVDGIMEYRKKGVSN